MSTKTTTLRDAIDEINENGHTISRQTEQSFQMYIADHALGKEVTLTWHDSPVVNGQNVVMGLVTVDGHDYEVYDSATFTDPDPEEEEDEEEEEEKTEAEEATA